MNPETRIAMSRHIATAVTSAIVGVVLLTGVASGRSAGWGQQPPSNLTPPAIGGTLRVGSSLTGSTGTWQRVSSYAFQWLRCNSAGASCGPISGATASTYTVSSADAGYTLRLLVTATNKNGSAAAVSAATQVVPSPTSSSPAPDTAITNVTCGTSVSAFPKAVCTDSNNDGGNSTTVTFTISNADGAQCQMDDGSYAGTWAPCTSGTVQFWVPVGGSHTLYVRAKRSSDGAVDSSPATASVTVCPSSGCSSPSAPAPGPPSATSPPTISGTAQQGQTLNASTGSWSGTTPMTYSYQWQRCDSGGASCTPLSGATSSGYLLTSGDVGHTMRVSVTASNSAGSATASSAATAVVNTSTATWTPTGDYFYNPFEASILTDVTTSPYYCGSPSTNCTNYTVGVQGFSQQGLGLVVTPTSGGPNAHSEDTAVAVQHAAAHSDVGASTWYRMRVMFPSSAFHPLYGEWNWLVQWHNQDGTTCCPSADSIGLGLSVASNLTDWRWELALRGGSASSPTTLMFYSPYGVKPDHWYDLVFHFVWDTKASNNGGSGSVDVWVDGVPFNGSTCSACGLLAMKHPQPFPTLYTSPTGTPDHPSHGIYNYRGDASGGNRWSGGFSSSRVNFDDWVIGPTAASVGFTS